MRMTHHPFPKIVKKKKKKITRKHLLDSISFLEKVEDDWFSETY